MKYFIAIAALWGVSFSSYAGICDPNSLREQLLKRNTIDQAARKQLQTAPQSKAALDGVLRIDAENTAFMREVLATCGWPKKSVVGKEAAKAAWRLTQHADMDPQYQVLAAQQMKYAVMTKDAEPWDLAVLVDRNRRLNDQPQVYGMQFNSTDGGPIEFYDIVNPGWLDERRKEIGLQPFFCWAMHVSKRNDGAAIRWPAGVLVRPTECRDDQ